MKENDAETGNAAEVPVATATAGVRPPRPANWSWPLRTSKVRLTNSAERISTARVKLYGGPAHAAAENI